MRSLFPLFLKLERRRCLVIGAGEIGEPKIASLLAAKGSVEGGSASSSEVTEGRASEIATEHEGDSTLLGTDTEKSPGSAPGMNPVFSQNGVLSDSGAGPLAGASGPCSFRSSLRRSRRGWTTTCF